MEGKNIELDNMEFTVLEELVFTLSFTEIKKTLRLDDKKLKVALKKMLQLKLIDAYYPDPDEKIVFDFQVFDMFYEKYYYLATKTGLKHLFG